MRQSLTRHHLQQELWVYGVVVLFLIAATSFVVQRLQTSYLEQTRSEISQLDGLMAQKIREFEQDLQQFAAVPPADRTPAMVEFLSHFADLVSLNEQMEVTRVYRRAPLSFLFEGFVYPEPLKQQWAPHSGVTVRPLTRGFERDEPSLYFIYSDAEQRLLARNNLQPLISFLDDYTQFSQNPVVLMNAQGVVIHSTLAGFTAPTISTRVLQRAASRAVGFDAANNSWLALSSGPNDIGLELLLLLPDDFLQIQLRGFFVLFLATFVLLLALFVVRNLNMRKHFLKPTRSIQHLLQQMKQGQGFTQLEPQNMLSEFQDIHGAIMAMHTAIEERTDALERSKDALQQQSKTWLKLLNSLPISIGTATVAETSELTFINDAMKAAFGYTQEDIRTLQQFTERLHPNAKAQQKFLSIWQPLAEPQPDAPPSVTPEEFTVTCRDGSLKEVLFQAVRLENQILFTLNDLTSHNQALRDMESLQQQLQRTALELLQNVPMGTYTMVQPADGGMAQFSFLSEQFLKFTGITREEALEDTLTAFRCIHPDDFDSWVAKNAEAFAEQKHFYGEVRVVIEGKVRWVIAESIPRKRTDGSVIWEGVLFDITDRKIAEQRLSDEQAQLRLILQELPLPILVIKHAEQPQLHLLNHRFTQQFGFTAADLTPLQPQLSQFTQGSELESYMLSQSTIPVREADSGLLEFEVQHHQGHAITVFCSLIQVGEFTLFAFVDISQIRETEQALLEAKNHAEQLQQVKSDFLAAMSHEIRTPLTSILGLTELMRQQPHISQQQAQSLERISAASDTLMRMLNDILDFSKLEAGELELEQRPFSFNQLLRRCEYLYEWQAQEKGVQLTVQQLPSEADWVVGDEVRLAQVLNNLVHNAVKFSHQGQVQLRVALIQKTARTLTVSVQVCDQGMGIDPSQFQFLLEPFTQSERGTARRFGGTGLGLPICNRLVGMMGGQLQLLPVPGFSTCLSFNLKLKRASQSVQSPTLEASVVDEHALSGRAILVADDSDLIQEWLHDVLVAKGAWVVCRAHGQAAIDYLQAHPDTIDLVLMDLQMPELDGIQTTLRLRHMPQFKRLPILGFTAGLQAAEKHAALAAGMNDVLIKPIAIADLVQHINAHLPQPDPDAQTTSASFEMAASQATQHMPRLSGLDVEHGLASVDHNPVLYIKLIKMFTQGLETVEMELNSALDEQDLERFYRRLHQLKGGAVQIGALELSATIQQLEAIKNPHSKLGQSALATMLHQIGDLVAEVKQHAADLNA